MLFATLFPHTRHGPDAARIASMSSVAGPSSSPENFTIIPMPQSSASRIIRPGVASRPTRQIAQSQAKKQSDIATSFVTNDPCARKFGSKQYKAPATIAAVAPPSSHVHPISIAPNPIATINIMNRARLTIASASLPGVW